MVGKEHVFVFFAQFGTILFEQTLHLHCTNLIMVLYNSCVDYLIDLQTTVFSFIIVQYSKVPFFGCIELM